jgi:hypothetical protein
MALTGVFCSSCGLEILADQKAINPLGTKDWYHTGHLYQCYTFKDMGVF